MNIYPSALDSTNQSSFIKATTSYITELTDSVATLSGGYLSGLLSPVTLSDAVNKSYVDSYITSNPSINVSTPTGSVQYNKNGVFGGSSNLIWTSNTNILTANTYSDGIVTWSSGLIQNLEEPLEQDEVSTKKYANNFNNMTVTEIDINENTEYTVSEVVNGLINRISYSSLLIDLTPLGTDIVNYIKGNTDKIGLTAYFTLFNKSVDNNSILLVPNIGVSMYSNNDSSGELEKILYLTLYKNYKANIKIYVISDTEVSFIIESIDFLEEYTNESLTQFISNSFDIVSNVNILTNLVQVQSNYLEKFNGVNIINDNDVTYSVDNILSGYIIRGPGLTANRTDKLVNTSILQQSIPYPYQSIQNNTTGLTFSVFNNDPTYSITLNTSVNGYTSDYIGSSTVIDSGKTGMFGISFGIDSSGTNTVWVYTIGIY